MNALRSSPTILTRRVQQIKKNTARIVHQGTHNQVICNVLVRPHRPHEEVGKNHRGISR